MNDQAICANCGHMKAAHPSAMASGPCGCMEFEADDLGQGDKRGLHGLGRSESKAASNESWPTPLTPEQEDRNERARIAHYEGLANV